MGCAVGLATVVRRLRAGIRWGIALQLWAGLAVAEAGAAARAPLKFCIADGEVPLYSSPQHEDLAQLALREAAQRQGRSVAFVVRPWRRCFSEVHEGVLQGMLPVAATPETLALVRLPEVDGRVDERLRIGSARILVMRRRGSGVDWNGQHFTGLQGPVLYLAGIKSLDEFFAHSDLPIDSSARGPEMLARMLLHGRSKVAVDLEWRIRRLAQDERFSGVLEVLPVPLLEYPHFLAISPALQDAEPAFVERLWRDTEQLYRVKLEQGRQTH